MALIARLWLTILVAACALPPESAPESAPESTRGQRRLGPEPLRVEVEVPDTMRAELDRADGTDGVYLVTVEGLALPATSSAFVRVFVDLPEADSATPVEHPAFLGYISMLPLSTDDGPERSPLDVAFELDRNHVEQMSDRRSLSLTLVPLAGNEENGTPSDFELLFDRISLDRRPG
jgi:hypothetical protein